MNEVLLPRKSLGASSTSAATSLVAKEVTDVMNRKAKEFKGLKPSKQIFTPEQNKDVKAEVMTDLYA